MTKAEIANAIRDFSLDVQAALADEFGTNKISTRMREFADRVEFEDESKPPWEQPAPPAPAPQPPGLYKYGEER